MNATSSNGLSIVRLIVVPTFLILSILSVSKDAHAICGLDGAVREILLSVEDPQALRSLSMKVDLHGSCAACHLARYGGPRNEFGTAVNVLLTRSDREALARQREVGRRMKEIVANPSKSDSPTFGDLFQKGRFPASSLVNREPPLPEAAAMASQNLSPEQAKQKVEQIEAESSFGILQLSRTHEITPEVAEKLAKFRGDTLILGIQSLSTEVAEALAGSQAANVWLHSITAVQPEAAEAIVKLRGHLILSGLTELDSVSLAEKLAARPGAVSFPYLHTITPQVAAALAKTQESLTLAGLTEISSEIQERLAETAGSLSLPNLVSLQSMSLAKKLASPSVLLPNLKEFTVPQLEPMIGVKGQDSFWGAVYLSTDSITPEIAKLLAATPRSINLSLVGDQPLDDESLRTLLKSRCRITLIDLQELSEQQIRIVSEELQDASSRQGVIGLAALSLPSIRKLDSALLAETLARTTGLKFPGVTSISPEAAVVLGNLPEQETKGADGQLEIRPSGNLNFPSLERLSPEIASLLFKRRWAGISLPSLRDVVPESVRLMAQQSSCLNLGIPTLYPEYAEAVSDLPADMKMGGGYLLFPNVSELSLDAAEILVQSLNRGVEVFGNSNFTRISKSPKLYFGGDFGFPAAGFKTLSPKVAKELAKYEGVLAIQGLRELPDESAAALASFPGPYLILSGPAAEKLSPAAAASLAEIPGVLQIQLRELDSVILARRLARQLSWTLSKLETISNEAAPALSQYNSFFRVRALRVLDSPEVARRLVQGTTGGSNITLPMLSELSPESARILASGDKPILLGLTVIDSSEVATALAQSRSKVSLPRLRAATPEAIEIMQLTERNLYVLPEAGRD